MHIIFDGDMLAYRASASVEKPIQWEKDLWTLHADAAEAKGIVDDMIQSYTEKVLNHFKYEGEYKITVCLSDSKDNFRKDILPTYKLNRQGKPKPICYTGVVDWILDNFDCVAYPRLEADDCMGILATQGDNYQNILVSGDKDFKTIPTNFYDFLRDSYYTISEEEADYWHLYQTLIGDIADNYKGCPRYGPVSAKKLLDTSPTWGAVLNAFIEKGCDEEYALTQARVARILRSCDFDEKTKTPILWTPKE